MKKLYHVIFVDEYNNQWGQGWFKNLDDSLESLNGAIDLYGNGKYVLEPGDIKEYVSTFGECFDCDLGTLFEEKGFEEAYDDFHSCQIRGYIYYFNDEDYEKAVELFVAEEDKKGSETIFELTYDTLITCLKQNQNKQILNIIEKEEPKALGELLDSLIEKVQNLVETKAAELIDLEKFNIDINKILKKDEWKALEEIYTIKKGLYKNADALEKIPLKNEMNFLGSVVYQWQYVEYYEYKEELYCFLNYCDNNKSMAFIEVSIWAKKESAM